MIPFLDKIAERLLLKFADNMEGVAIVLPSKRAVVFLKYYLSQKIEKPIFLPEFYSVEEFIEKLSGLVVLDNISLQFRLYQTYLKFPPKKIDSFDDFLKWSNVLLHDFNEIDRNLTDANSIYTNLTNVKEMEGWSINDWSLIESNLTNMQSDYISFFEGMLDWYKHFQSSLLDDHFAYQGLAYRKVADQIEHVNISWNKVWFVGLNALTRSEQSIINHLKKKDIARIFWDADNFYFRNPLHEAGSFLRKQNDKWSEIDFEGIGDYLSINKKQFNVIACPKNIAQAKVTAEVISNFTKEDLENSNTAIVLADEGLLFPVLNNLPSQVKQLNVTMGSPIKNTTLYAFVEDLFTMHIHALKYKQNGFYYKDVVSVIEHPYFSKLFVDEDIIAFKYFLIKNNIVFVSNDNIENYFKKFDMNQVVFGTWNNATEIISFLHVLVDKLRVLLVGKRGSIESEVLSTFYKTLNILDKLIFEYNIDIEIRTLQVIMQQLVAKETIPFKGEPLKGVQLMGILESRTLDFKNVIILSVNEGKLPKGKVLNSFIPYDMKRYFALPTYSESDAVFSYHFYRLLQRAQNITLLYNSETDDFGSGEKSRFITQLLAEYKGDIKELVYKGNKLEQSSNKGIVIKNEGLEKEIKAWANSGVSPSALNKYNNCSLQFYYHYLAKVRAGDQVDEYVDASIMGTIIHDALDQFYPIGIISQKIIKNNTNSIMKYLEDKFALAFSKNQILKGKNYLSLKIAQKLISGFLKLEIRLLKRADEKKSQIKIVCKEQELKYSLTLNEIDFNLIGKVDRVDFDSEVLRIIDYKTGNVDNNEVEFTEYDEIIDNSSKAKAFQLLMYSYLYLKNNTHYIGTDVNAGIFSFKNLDSGLISLSRKISSRKKQIIKIDENALESFQYQLENILLSIMNNDFIQTSNLKACEFCDYKTTCKR